MQSRSYQSNTVRRASPSTTTSATTKSVHDFSKFDKHRWSEEMNSSVFVKRIPDWLEKDDIKRLFDSEQSPIAQVSRVHIVDVSPDKGVGRMAFVHFNDWYNTPDSQKFRDVIVDTDNFVKVVHNPSNKVEKFYLNITANRRPIAVTTYDNDQLSDMINTSNKAMALLHKTVAAMNHTIAEQSNRISQLERLLQPPMPTRSYSGTSAVVDLTEEYGAMAQEVIDGLMSGTIVDPVLESILKKEGF